MLIPKNWTTQDELAFVKGLGRFVDGDFAARKDRTMDLLACYLTASRLRTKWVGIDRERAIEAAQARLTDLMLEKAKP